MPRKKPAPCVIDLTGGLPPISQLERLYEPDAPNRRSFLQTEVIQKSFKPLEDVIYASREVAVKYIRAAIAEAVLTIAAGPHPDIRISTVGSLEGELDEAENLEPVWEFHIHIGADGVVSKLYAVIRMEIFFREYIAK